MIRLFDDFALCSFNSQAEWLKTYRFEQKNYEIVSEPIVNAVEFLSMILKLKPKSVSQKKIPLIILNFPLNAHE